METYLWKSTVNMPAFPSLDRDIEADVLVVGGGMAGILTARMLKEQGADCVLTEAKTIGSGTTRGTTAVITAQHGLLYTKLLKKFGRQKAYGYLKANLEAVEKYRALADKFDFDFEDKPSYTYSLMDKKGQAVEAAVVRDLGFPAEFTEDIDIPLDIAGAVRFPNMAQFHPLKFVSAVSRDLKIYENTLVKELDGTAAITSRGRIKAEKVVIASHYPFINTHGLYPMKLYQKRSFVLALENAPEFKGTYADAADGGIYMRNYKELLIVGGGDYRTGKRNDGFKTVRQFVMGKFPEAKEKYAWAAQDCMSLDDVPYIGRYSSTLPKVYVISGFNEWGMTSSMAAASIITDMIMGRENKYAHVFAPDRSLMSSQLLSNVGETMMNFLRPTTRRCSHLGCGLKKNLDEGTWDCSCHGSRFDEHGHPIDNPAMKDARI